MAREITVQLVADATKFKEGMASAVPPIAAVGVAVVAAGIGIAAVSLKMAADFQTSMAHLVNDAGESKKAMKMVTDGVLAMAGEVGVAPLKLADALYFVESAGYHGAQALAVLRASAIAAKVAGADMTSVADITTSALNAYGLAGTQATHVTDILMQSVAEGKMRFQDLALAMPTVLPTAASLKISMQEVGAAIATMTMQGDHASDAATHLRMLMLMLVAPTSMSAKALKDLGMNADEATKHNNAAVQALAKLHITSTDLAASMTSGGPNALLNTLTMLQTALDKTFPSQSDPRREGLLKTILSVKGMQAALELTGVHLKQFTANELGMADASRGVGKTMEGWADVQGEFNTKMEQFRAKLEVVAIQIGQKLLPVATRFADWLMNSAVPGIENAVKWIQNAIKVMGTWHDLWNAIGNIIAVVSTILRVVLPPAIATAGGFINALITGARILYTVFTDIVTAIQNVIHWFQNMASVISKSPVSGILGGIGHAAHVLNIPGFAAGTDYVPQTGLAIVHQGEQIIPAGHRGGGGVNVYINIAQGAFIDGPSVDRLANTIAQRLSYATGR